MPLRYDSDSRTFRNDLTPAAPGPGEATPVGTSSAYWNRMFSESGGGGERIAAVFACVYVIASSIAAMPLALFRRDGQTRARVRDTRLSAFLDDRPNAAMTWPQLREAMLYQLLLRGNAYTRNFWRAGYLEEVFPVSCHYIEPKLTDKRRLGYELRANDFHVPPGMFYPPDVAHFRGISQDGLEGISPIAHCRMTMASAAALTKYGKDSAENGNPIKGVLSGVPAFPNEEKAREVRNRWRAAMQEIKTASDGVLILEGGQMKLEALSMSLRDAQFIEQMKFSVEEVARIFNVPLHKIQHLDKATFNNIEHLSKEFYMATLVPWITRLESTMNSVFLTKSERDQGYYFRHNADGLLRGDLASRSMAYQQQISSAVMTPNEARQLEERPPMPGGDVLLFPVNHVPLDKLENQTEETEETDEPGES